MIRKRAAASDGRYISPVPGQGPLVCRITLFLLAFVSIVNPPSPTLQFSRLPSRLHSLSPRHPSYPSRSIEAGTALEDLKSRERQPDRHTYIFLLLPWDCNPNWPMTLPRLPHILIKSAHLTSYNTTLTYTPNNTNNTSYIPTTTRNHHRHHPPGSPQNTIVLIPAPRDMLLLPWLHQRNCASSPS